MSSGLDGFKKSLVYEVEQPIPSIQADIERIREFDQQAESRQRAWGGAGCGGVLLGIACVIVGAMLEQPLIMACALGGLALAIVGGILWKVNRGYNVSNNRYLLTGRVLRLLAADTAADAPVALRLDLHRADHKRKFVGKGEASHWKVKYYEDPFLRLRGRLLDGTAYDLTVVEKHQARSRWKRSASGKSKLKTKTKLAWNAMLRLKPKSDKHVHLDRLADDVGDAVRLPSWVSLKSVALDNGALAMKVATKSEWKVTPDGKGVDGVEMIAMMFLSLYQVLNLSRKMTKAG